MTLIKDEMIEWGIMMHLLSVFMVLFAFVILMLFLYKEKINQKILLYSVAALIIMNLVHSFLDLATWQLTPFYVFWLFLLLYIKFEPAKRILRIIYVNFMLLLLIVSLGLLYVFPSWDIPDPTGPYPIGSYYTVIDDEDRYELYTDDPTDKRSFMLRVWYPAKDPLSDDITKWVGNNIVTGALAKDMGLPAFSLSHLRKIESNAFHLASIHDALETYPVVIISHGWGGFMNLHVDLAEELASRGYIVVSIDHTYGSVATTFMDKTVYQNKDALPGREDPTFLEKANQLVNTYAGDVMKTLDYLEEQQEKPNATLFGRLDLDHIGLIGHSTGGGADVFVALNDDRVKALLGLDAWVEPIGSVETNKGLTIPSLFLRSQSWEVGPNNNYLYDLILNSPQARLYQIDGTTHADFTMAYMFSPLTGMLGITGSLEKSYLLQMQKDLMNSFFDEHLKGVNEELNLSIYQELKPVEIS